MKRFDKITLAAALLAGTALATAPAMAESDSKELLKGGASAEIGGSAKAEAPGQKQLSGEVDAAAEAAPGQKQLSGEVDAAAEAAPGQLKKDNADDGSGDTTAEADADADIDAGASAEAPGQKMLSGEVDSAAEAAPGQQMLSGEVDSASEAAPGQVSNETTASIDITGEQETELRTAFDAVEIELEPAEVDAEVTIGATVPDTIELQPLPSPVVEIVPEYDGYEYFVMADGQVVIVEPATYEVVYIVSG